MATTNWYTEAKNAYQQRAENEAQKLGISIPSNFSDLANSLAGKANYSGNLNYYGDTDYRFFKIAVGNKAPVNNEYTVPYNWVVTNFNPESAVNLYANNRKDFYEKVLNQKGWDYAKAYFDVASNQTGNPAFKEALNKKQTELQNLIIPATLAGVSAKEYQDSANKGVSQWTTTFQKDVAASKDTGFWGAFSNVMAIAQPVAFAAMTSGLALPQQVLVNAAYGLSNGGKPEDIVRGIIGSIAANQVPGILKELNQQISSAAPQLFEPTVKAALINAERQAVNALATGQDVGRAALAGVAGGAASDVGLLASDSTAIARAAGEYTQALAAGLTQDQALTKALSGFVTAEQATARQKVLDTASQGQTATQDKTGAIDQTAGATGTGGGAITSQGGDKSLPEVTVTAGTDQDKQILDLISTGQTTVDKSGVSKLPEVVVTASPENVVAADLSTISTTDTGTKDTSTGKAKTDTGVKDSILLSLLNQPLTTQYAGGGSQGPTQTQLTYGPGSQALAQALRIGDAGLPVFGGDKEKSKRSGWNVESLRYMGNSEA